MSDSAESVSAIGRDEREEQKIGDYPNLDGITRGTVMEYDDWQWAIVTEIDEDYEPAKVGFVLVDKLDDDVVVELEGAWGCWEHYQCIRRFRDGPHEYWTDAEYVSEDDIWTTLGPIHPDERTEEEEATA